MVLCHSCCLKALAVFRCGPVHIPLGERVTFVFDYYSLYCCILLLFALFVCDVWIVFSFFPNNTI